MSRSFPQQLGFLFIFVVLALSGGASAQMTSADQRLENFIRLNQFASPYAGGQFPEQWCYYTNTDHTYSWWYLSDSVSGTLAAVQAQNGFGIPFTVKSYGGTAAILVGYEVKGGSSTADLEPVSSFAANASECDIGIRILTNGPYPIVGLARNLAAQTATDPAHEYRIWFMRSTYHRVRLISAIPVSFQVGSNQIAGRIVLGFTGDW